MREPHAPLPPADKVPSDDQLPETEAPERDWLEGQLPGMPVSRDPLLNPGPTPGQVEKPPLD